MDAPPAPFPGKRRVASKYASKTGEGTAVAKKPPWQNVTAAAAATAQIRPKRSFGVPRSTNIVNAPVEKPLFVPKQRKIPPLVKSPPDLDPVLATKKEVRVSNKKQQEVSFQDPKTTTAGHTSDKNEPEEVVGTPMPMIKPAFSGTPYLTAQNCSKCKLDELESSDYWISHIRLAESTGKHFVSAAFFRLALECHAQPSHKLRSELRHYVTRHPVDSTTSVWTDLYQAYGLEKEKLVYYSCNLVLDNSLLAEMDDGPDTELCCPEETRVSLIEKNDSETTFDTVLLGCEAPNDECPVPVNVDQVEVGQSTHVIADDKYIHCDGKGLEKMEQSDNLLVDTLTSFPSAKDNLCDEKELEKSEQSESLSIDALTNCSSPKDNLCDEKETEKMEQSEILLIDNLTNCSSPKHNLCVEKELEKMEKSEFLLIDNLKNCSSPKHNLCDEKESEKMEQSEFLLIDNLTNCSSPKHNLCDEKELEKMEQSEILLIDNLTNCSSPKHNLCDEKESEKKEQSESLSTDTLTNCSSRKDKLCGGKELEKMEQSESLPINNLTNCCSVKDNNCLGKQLEKMEQSESWSTDNLADCCSAKDNDCDKNELEPTQKSKRQSIDTITGSNCCTAVNIPGIANKPLEGTVSESKASGDSFNNKSKHSSNNSFQQKKVPTSTKGRGMFSSKVSAKNAVRIGDGKCRKNRSDQITGKNKGHGNVKAVSKVEQKQMGEN